MDTMERFLRADWEGKFHLLDDSETRRQVERHLGQAAFAELLEHRPDDAHLGAGPKNILFVPGVMGSTLQSEGLGGVWWIDMVRARNRINGLALRPDGRGDLDPDADIQPGVVDLSYFPFLKAVSQSDAFGGCRQFAYDWRRPLDDSAAALRDAVLRCHQEYGEPVHLVGHSMGGLMIRTALMRHGEELWSKLGRIVFIATPHYGSPSISGYLKNHLSGWERIAVLGFYLSPATFRSLRGVLSLLPAPKGVYPGTRDGEDHPTANFELYRAEAWELGLNASETADLQDLLDQVADLHRRLFDWHDQQLLQDEKDRMLVIAGVGHQTLFRLDFDEALWGRWKYTKRTTERTACRPHREGDGRVPLASAALEDVAIRYVKGVHGGLPNIPSVSRDVLAWLQGRTLSLSDNCADASGDGHLSADEAASPAPHLDGTAQASEDDDSYAVYRDIPEDRLEELRREAEAGRFPDGINLVRLL